ncbi:MAG TPA: amidohydrolase family protein [Actinomycetota bacterium]|nr:amidohydrolase family protein [Actinomycetota bacterium]
MTTVFRGGPILRLPGGATAEWVLVAGEQVQAVGHGEPPAADRVVDLDGGTLMPAFCDAHVHLPATGLYELGLDFRGERSAAAILDSFSQRAREGGGVLFGGNFEDPLDAPLTRIDLDRAVGERPALLARADMHSCVVSTALLDELDVAELEGVDVDHRGVPTGYLREKAASEAWGWFDRTLPPEQQKAAVRSAVARAYSKGIASVHEMFVVEWRGWPSLEVFLDAISDAALDIVTYVGTSDVDRVHRIGFDRVGGDFFLDGSFGSHTAWMSGRYLSEPPQGSPPNGISYRTDEELLEVFMRAQALEMQCGVHAIGDAAIEQAIATWEKVADKVGIEAVRALGHRIEHFECSWDDHLRRAAALGLRASVQPAFDRYWGGPAGLYADRIGWERARDMNRFGSMLNAGLLVGAGSDSTVTPMDPFLQLAALREHHVEGESLGRIEALRLHTTGARALGEGPSLSGTLEPDAPADLVWLDRNPAEVDTDRLVDTEVLGTWVLGRQVWPPSQAETE